jgi:hypothetical protein
MYAVMNSDLTAYAYIDMGWLKFDTFTPHKSGTFDDLSKAQYVLDKIDRARQKQIGTITRRIDRDGPKNPKYPNYTYDADHYATDLEKLNAFTNAAFSIVKIVVEKVDPSQY